MIFTLFSGQSYFSVDKVLIFVAASDGSSSGMYYGSLYEPALAGSRGGPGPTNTLGGRGGGRIFIKVANRFYMDGTLYVDGDDGSDGSGGGSGGATWIVCGK